jgi:hypothetical protein
MRSAIVAMLWENWRLTRVEVAQRLALGIVAASAALVWLDAGPTAAFWILITLHGMFFLLSILKLNGGRFMDGYKPGFPFYLLYTRPVPTAVFVSVVMGYEAVSCIALYVVSASLVGFAFGQPLPLLSVVAWILAFHLCYACVQWSTQNRVVQWVGSIAFSLPLFFLLKYRVASPLQVEFSLIEHAVMVSMCVVAFALTVAGVARQRRGDAVATVPRAAGSGGYPDWLVNLFRFPCPTSSATKAQVWFELKSSGLPVLVIGLGVAILIMLLFAISTAFGQVRLVAVPVVMLAVPIVLFGLGSNAFGIRRKQGRTYASAFELTQPRGTAQLASLKVFVRAICVLVALMAISASLWASNSMVGAWGEWVLNNHTDVAPELLKLRQRFADALGGLTAFAHVALAIVASIAVAGVVAWQATREALRARFPRLLLVVQWLPAVLGLTIILLTLALRKGFGPVPLVGDIVKATFWIAGAAMLSATIYFLWSGFAERVLTIRYACGALVISAAFGSAWRAGIPAGDVVGIVWLALVILMVSVLAPWSLNRIRHT